MFPILLLTYFLNAYFVTKKYTFDEIIIYSGLHAVIVCNAVTRVRSSTHKPVISSVKCVVQVKYSHLKESLLWVNAVAHFLWLVIF